jgi:hypothetical protein
MKICIQITIQYVQVRRFWLPNPGFLVAVLRRLDRSLNLPALHVLLARLASQGLRLLEKAPCLKLLLLRLKNNIELPIVD